MSNKEKLDKYVAQILENFPQNVLLLLFQMESLTKLSDRVSDKWKMLVQQSCTSTVMTSEVKWNEWFHFLIWQIHCRFSAIL